MTSLEFEEQRCHWRRRILAGELGEKAKQRLLACIEANLPERHCI